MGTCATTAYADPVLTDTDAYTNSQSMNNGTLTEIQGVGNVPFQNGCSRDMPDGTRRRYYAWKLDRGMYQVCLAASTKIVRYGMFGIPFTSYMPIDVSMHYMSGVRNVKYTTMSIRVGYSEYGFGKYRMGFSITNTTSKTDLNCAYKLSIASFELTSRELPETYILSAESTEIAWPQQFNNIAENYVIGYYGTADFYYKLRIVCEDDLGRRGEITINQAVPNA
ncbi:hypothetical protein D2E26_0415 [Bifidobacterium dolichotidis]|uniref:Uncharacterized protein n=2 Tax=Bifidobacterium dolichotidis TaxID=2306976 RepID=A0A430FSI6_9BIFI|nr:hypothetical protein D2E26_0415 [Bifidobacterium dolichotidis]